MKSRIDKKLIHEVCIHNQQELIESFQQRESEMYNDTFMQNTSPSQTEDRKADKVDLLSAMGTESTFAQEELAYLVSVDVSEESASVEPGAVVATDSLTFFIGVSTGKFEVNGEEFFGISTKAPIYAGMKGQKKGGTFQFNETKYLIEDLY